MAHSESRRFYSSHSMTGKDDVWLGEALPSVAVSAVDQMEELKANLHTMISSMQTAITSELVNLDKCNECGQLL